jgi:cell pole-organizing protein PopZ
MSESRKDASEPSMEEILSSIRKIIAEEEDGAATRLADAPRAPGTASRDDDILELTERIVDTPPASRAKPADDLDTIPAAPPRPAPAPPRAVPVETDVQKTPSFAETQPSAPVPSQATAPTRPLPAEASMTEQLVSTDAASLSTAALAKLARVAVPPTLPPQLPAGGITVEQLVIDLLKPMLKDWLDQNLPAVVERIVEEEVKKLVRRAELS